MAAFACAGMLGAGPIFSCTMWMSDTKVMGRSRLGRVAFPRYVIRSFSRSPREGCYLIADPIVSVRALILAWCPCLTHRGRDFKPGAYMTHQRWLGPECPVRELCHICNACIFLVCLRRHAGSWFNLQWHCVDHRHQSHGSAKVIGVVSPHICDEKTSPGRLPSEC